jgi:hypothetical protein
MKINTEKIIKEMGRLQIGLAELGQRFDPPKTKYATWYIIHHAKTMSIIDEIGKALDMEGKDLII